MPMLKVYGPKRQVLWPGPLLGPLPPGGLRGRAGGGSELLPLHDVRRRGAHQLRRRTAERLRPGGRGVESW